MAHSTIDLHLHSNYSDGTWSPAQVIAEAARCGLRTVALTDHDTIDGIAEAKQAAVEHGITCVSGIELSAQDDGHDYHFLGLLIDERDATFGQTLRTLIASRRSRIEGMIARLAEHDVHVSIEEVMTEAGHGTVGRPHVATVLLRRGLVRTVDEAFDRWLGYGKPAHIKAYRLSPRDAIAMIQSVGGVPVLAHPVYLNDDAVIPVLVDAGLAGIEVYHPGHSSNKIRHYTALARQHGLIITGGSDCHGTLRGEPQIGCMAVPDSVIEELHAWRAQQTTN